MPIAKELFRCTTKELSQYIEGNNIDDEHIGITQYPPKSNPKQQMEGWVIKNITTGVYAKKVRSQFKEENSLVFGGGRTGGSDTDKLVAKYVTNARIEKAIFFFIDQGKELGMQLMPMIIGYVYMDMWEENWKTIVKKAKQLNLVQLKREVTIRCKSVLMQVITNNTLGEKDDK